MKRAWFTICTVLILAGMAAVPASGSTPSAPAGAPLPGNTPAAATTVAFTTAPARNGMVSLQAKLTGPGGQPVANQTVVFEQMTSFFGERPAHIGTEVTDTAGTATLIHNPSVAGTYRLRARFAGNTGFAPTAAETNISVEGSVLHAEEVPDRLQPVWQMTMIASAVVTAAVWLAMLVIMVLVRRSLSVS